MNAACIYGGVIIALMLTLAAGPAMPVRILEPDLMNRSTFVANTQNNWWSQGIAESSFCGIGVQWLSDRVILHDRFTRKPNIQRRVICRLDLRTGRDQTLPGLSKAMDGLEPEVIDSNFAGGEWNAR